MNEGMQLTPAQLRAVLDGDVVRLLEPQSNVECVLIRAESYDRIKSLFEEVPLSPEEQLQLLAESGERAGWLDPLMDAYDDYDANQK